MYPIGSRRAPSKTTAPRNMISHAVFVSELSRTDMALKCPFLEAAFQLIMSREVPLASVTFATS